MRRTPSRTRGSLRGSPALRLRIGFVLITMLLSVLAARLVQLQGVDPGAYAEMAAAEGTEDVVLPAERGTIRDRNNEPLAESISGLMVVADPWLTAEKAPELAQFLSRELDIDYFTTLERLRKPDSKFQYIARQVPASLATETVRSAKDAGFDGLTTRRDPRREYPAQDVAANLIGFLGTPEDEGAARPLAGFELTFDTLLAGKDGSARYAVAQGTKVPLGESTVVRAVDGQDLTLTVDRDLSWYTQRVARQLVEDNRAESAVIVVQDTASGEVLTLADYPTYDASDPLKAPKKDLGSRAMSDVYEPGSVQKVLTMAGLLDAGLVTPRTRMTVPESLKRQDRAIGDWFEHGEIKLTLTGVLAKSSNIGTVLAADKYRDGELRNYLTEFGLGSRTNVGVRGESPGILPAGAQWTSQTQDRIAFGQAVSVNALQMTAALNTVANGGLYVAPSLIKGRATTDDGREVGTDTVRTHRVVSKKAARQTAAMMERVVDPEAGVAPRAAIPGYRVAGKTGTAQRANSECGCYDGSFTVSFGGFAPADDPRFTVYVMVQNPGNNGGGGSVAGPAFAKVMSYALRHYQVPPTGTEPSTLPVEWGSGSAGE